MRLVDHPELVASWPEPSSQEPWRILLSGCMAGWPCGVDGTSYGMEGAVDGWVRSPHLHVVAFCPEETGLGTPRGMPDLHGGDGFDVLEGRARVLDEKGNDLTEGMIAGARAMVQKAEEEKVRFCVLTDSSGACGTQVVYRGCRFDDPPVRQRGVGVAAAALHLAGFPVVAQRDHKTIALIRARLDASFRVPEDAVDHHDSEWVRRHLPVARVWPTP